MTDLMDRCQMGDTLSDEEVQIISYYLDLAAGEEELMGSWKKTRNSPNILINGKFCFLQICNLFTLC